MIEVPLAGPCRPSRDRMESLENDEQGRTVSSAVSFAQWNPPGFQPDRQRLERNSPYENISNSFTGPRVFQLGSSQGTGTGDCPSYDHTMRTKSFLAIFISGIISGTHSFRRLIVGYKIEEIIGTGRSPPERSSGPSLGTRLWPKSTVISIQFLASSSSLPSCSATIWLAREALWKIVPHLLGPRKIVIAPYHIKRVVGSTFTRVANSVSISCQPEDLQGQSHFGMCSRIHCAPVERVRCDGGHARRRIVRKLAGHGY